MYCSFGFWELGSSELNYITSAADHKTILRHCVEAVLNMDCYWKATCCLQSHEWSTV